MVGSPKVSAILIAGLAQRELLTAAAIESFRNQTYENKELVIINDGKSVLGDPASNEREIMLEEKLSLGELRNVGLKQATGDFVIQWDSDDWSHPDRIAYQLAGVAAGYCVLLRRQIRYDMVDNNAFVFTWGYPSCAGIPGTILHPLLPTDRIYPGQSKSEDEVFIRSHFHDRCIVMDLIPHLYLRFAHGSNTWDQRHIMQNMPGFPLVKNAWYLPRDAASYLANVLQQHYGLEDRHPQARIVEPQAS